MPLFNLSVKHGQTLDEARSRLEIAVGEARTRFGPLVQRVEWAADRGAVTMSGAGFTVQMHVDALEVHASCDFPLLGGLLGNNLVSGLKGIIQRVFQKRLT